VSYNPQKEGFFFVLQKGRMGGPGIHEPERRPCVWLMGSADLILG
jgi:hypothetical protein